MKYNRSLEFWLALILLSITVIFSVVVYVHWFGLAFFIGSLFIVHWLGLVATIFIAVLVPIYYILKRKRSNNIKTLLRIHVFGNLFSFMFVSIHFAQNIGRLAAFYPKLGYGFLLFIVLCTIVTTGLLERFSGQRKLVRYTKFVHRYSVVVFYLVAIIHTLQGFNVI
ncbi:hypothetical protein ACFLRN_06130 [Thermoproteota archaeon]